MKFKVIMKDGTHGEVECDNYNNSPDAAWEKYGKMWSEVVIPMGVNHASGEKHGI